MSISAESDGNSSDGVNNHNKKEKKDQVGPISNKTKKSQLESKLESLPSAGMRRVASGHALQRSASRSRLNRGSGAATSNNNRRKFKKILSESSLNTSASNLGFKPSANTNAAWDPIGTTAASNRPKGTKPQKRGLRLEDPSEHSEEGGDTVPPLLIARSSAGSRKVANGLLKRAVSLKGFGLAKQKPDSESTTTESSPSTTLDLNNNKNKGGRRTLLQKAASISLIGKQAKWDSVGYGGFDEKSQNSEEFSLHSTNRSIQLQSPQTQKRDPGTRPTAALSSLGQSLRRLDELSKQNDGDSNGNNGSSTRFGDSLSADADYSVSTWWQENSEEAKPGLQFAPSTMASLGTEKMAQVQNPKLPKVSLEPATEAKSEEPAGQNVGQSSSNPTSASAPISAESDDKTPAATASTSASSYSAHKTLPKTPASPAKSERTKKSRRTKSKTKRRKKGSSRNVTAGEEEGNDNEMAMESDSVKRSKKSGSVARRTRKGRKREDALAEDAAKKAAGGGDDIEEEALKDGPRAKAYRNDSEDEDIQSNDGVGFSTDEDSDIMSVSDSDYEKSRSYSRSNRSQKLPSDSGHSEKPLGKDSGHSEKPRSASKSGHSAFSLPPPPTAKSTSKSPRSSGRLSPYTSPKRTGGKPNLKLRSLSPGSKLSASRKSSIGTISSDGLNNPLDSDEESRASRRVHRRTKLRKSKSLFGSERGINLSDTPKKASRRRQSLGGAEQVERKGKGYISSFLGSKLPG